MKLEKHKICYKMKENTDISKKKEKRFKFVI